MCYPTQIYFRWKETAVEDDHKGKKCNKIHMKINAFHGNK